MPESHTPGNLTCKEWQHTYAFSFSIVFWSYQSGLQIHCEASPFVALPSAVETQFLVYLSSVCPYSDGILSEQTLCHQVLLKQSAVAVCKWQAPVSVVYCVAPLYYLDKCTAWWADKIGTYRIWKMFLTPLHYYDIIWTRLFPFKSTRLHHVHHEF